MWKLMMIAGIGGFVGTCCRFLMNKLVNSVNSTPYPIATFLVNILGCFIFGIIYGVINKNGVIPPKINALLIVGFCGGFTTFSTFSFESLNLILSGNSFGSLTYIISSVVVGLLALWIGIFVTK